MRGRARIGIAGGGIGGLATAIAISRKMPSRRFDISVYERAERHDAGRGGAALLLWSNAVAAMAELGLEQEIRAASAELAETEVRSVKGGLLSSLPIGDWSASAGLPTVVVRRPVLIDILRAAIPPNVTLHMGRALRSYEEARRRVLLSFDDGSVDEVDGLIGADGFHSVVRRELLGEEPSRAGYDAWVGITPHRPEEIRRGVATATIGAGPRFWTAALRDGSVFWYATLNRRVSEPVRDREALLDVYRDWPAPIEELIETTPDSDLVRTQIRDRSPVTAWGSGPVTLLGDAAHPSTPDLGQGACQAIESAAVIGDCLREHVSVSDAFRTYEQRRMARTAAISRLCWMTSVNSTVESDVMCRLRDAAIRVALVPAARSSLRWILAGHTQQQEQESVMS